MYALYLIHAEETMFIPLLLAKYKATTGGIRVVDDNDNECRRRQTTESTILLRHSWNLNLSQFRK